MHPPDVKSQVKQDLRTSATGLLVLAVAVGAAAAGFAVLFRWLITTFTVILSGHSDYSAVAGAAHPALPGLGRWFVVFAPVVAGLLYGPLVHLFAREARGHGVPEVMYAVARRGGRIPPQVAGVKALASALCIGGGGSVGREGPIVQIGSAVGSTVGRVLRMPEPRMRVLVACGAAGGIAATFNAPLAGVFFAMELILADFTTRSFGAVVVSSVTASVIGRAVLGDDPFLDLPTFEVHGIQEYLWFAVLGLAAGVVGTVFIRVLYAVEDGCDRFWRGPEWLRPAVGGVLLGGLLLAVPEMYGVGYPVLANGVAGAYVIGFLLVLLIAKMLATSLTIGIGGSGGVFAPSLFVGAMLGAAFGQSLAAWGLEPSGQAGAFALVGMGAVFSGAARAPITAVIIMFELTGEYTIILPMMAAIVLSTAVSHALSTDTIYTAKLSRRGVDLRDSPADARLRSVRTHDVMDRGSAPVVAGETVLASVAPALARSAHGLTAVTDEHGKYAGVLTAHAVADALSDGEHDDQPVADLAERPETVRPDAPLTEALQVLENGLVSAVPVVTEDDRLVGWVSAQNVLFALRRGVSQPGPGPGPTAAPRRRPGRRAGRGGAPARVAGTPRTQRRPEAQRESSERA